MASNPALERVRREHQFHLLNDELAYCVCGWISDLPKGWEDHSPRWLVIHMVAQWDSHTTDLMNLEGGRRMTHTHPTPGVLHFDNHPEAHHHHGDDGSTLYHQHNVEPDHDHNHIDATCIYGPADHDHT